MSLRISLFPVSLSLSQSNLFSFTFCFFVEKNDDKSQNCTKSLRTIHKGNTYNVQRASRTTSSTDGGVQPSPTVNLCSNRDSAKTFANTTREKVQPPTQPNQLHLFSQQFWCHLRLEEGDASGRRGPPTATPAPRSSRWVCSFLRRASSRTFSQSGVPQLALPSQCNGDPWLCPRRPVLLKTVNHHLHLRLSTLGSAKSKSLTITLVETHT